MLHGGDGRDGHALQRAQLQPRIDELVGKKFQVRIGEAGADFHRAGSGVHEVVDGLDGARRDLPVVRTVIGDDGQILARPLRLPHLLDEILRQHEDHRDRLQLRQHDDPVGVGKIDVIAGIDQPQADPPGDRRDDMAIIDVEVLLGDQGLVGGDLTLVLPDDKGLILRRLAGDGILFEQGRVALVVELGLIQHALIMRQLAFILGLQRLIGPRVDLRQEIALLDDLTFLEADRQQLSGDLRLHGDRRQRRHRAEAREDLLDVALGRFCRADLRHRRLGLFFGGPVLAQKTPDPEPSQRHRQQNEQQPQRAFSCRRRRRRNVRSACAGQLFHRPIPPSLPTSPGDEHKPAPQRRALSLVKICFCATSAAPHRACRFQTANGQPNPSL